MTKKKKTISEFQIAMRSFKKNQFANVCVVILFILYGSAIFADFLSPYSFKNEERRYSYAPPTSIKIWDKGKLVRPYIHGFELSYNEYHQRIYKTDGSRKYALKLFYEGDQYKLLGLFPCQYHLFGVERGGRLYLLGADSRGRDLFSRLLFGARVSLSIGLIGVIISFSIGLIIGGISGYYGGKIDNFLMRISEMVMMVPGFYLLLALRAAVPDDFSSVQVYFAIILILSFLGWAGLSRIIRGMCLSLRERDYVLAAKSLGLSDLTIIIRHILPHTLSYSIFCRYVIDSRLYIGRGGAEFDRLRYSGSLRQLGEYALGCHEHCPDQICPMDIMAGLFYIPDRVKL